MQIDFSRLSPTARYFLMTQTIIPRPVAWILTRNDGDDGDGAPSFNLAPFSYFCAVCSDPALLMVSIGETPGGGDKNTARNIRARERFVVHIAPQNLVRALNETAASLPYGESEIDKAGLSLAAFADGENGADSERLPRLRECPLAFDCRLRRTLEVGAKEAQTLFFGEITRAFAADDAARVDSRRRVVVDAAKIDPLARLGAGAYAALGKIIDLPRPL